MCSRYEKWEKWIGEILSEVQELSDHRYIFLEVQKIIENNPRIQKPSSFYRFVGSWYSTSAVMCIRRQIKNQKDSISLARLLSEIISEPEVLSRKNYLNICKKDDKPFDEIEEYCLNKDFDGFSGKVNDYVDPDFVSIDLNELQSISKNLETYADRRLAHRDKRDINKIPTFGELDECIKVLERLTTKYNALIVGVSVILPPVYQYDWEAIFRMPWIDSKKA